ncbi:MAG TPA: hypothetical protein VN843_29340 [Anaerolineales bacterium]|nr:hypothetical protein [Anaerolineales bacterium]
MALLNFQEVPNPGKRTKRWKISSGGVTIGWIEFWSPWRKYVWSMVAGSIFDVNCTTEVVEFLKLHANDKQKEI